ncbi:MAG: isocitrate lyase/PEP mutase family protein [Chloroflexota bacterium]|nr:isocitrate lyase/PEP mutase family protein [Chloroflexota bacterium]|tara:strand:+ start:2796 stop:3653 length:858 start_codon:yes stop_codon:yes gene_type:complete
MEKATKKIRKLLSGGDLTLAPFAYDAFAARIAEETGFEAVYMSGFGVSMSKGMPDFGLLTQTEMVQNASYIAQSVDIPVIADADTGYGNPINTFRTVREYEKAGVAAIHIEDQVAPKKCGFFEGKDVIPLGEAVEKIRSAVDARTDPDFVIIGRTDALAVNGWEDTIARCRAFYKAGADIVFVDGIKTQEDLIKYAESLQDMPRMYNGQLPVSDVAELGFKIQIHRGPMFGLHTAISSFMKELFETGAMAQDADGDGAELREAITKTLKIDELLEMEAKYAIVKN